MRLSPASPLNITANDSVPGDLERTLIASVIALASGTSLVSYFILLATILYSKKLRQNPFYQVLFSLAINDALCQFTYAAIAAPSIYVGFVQSESFSIVVTTIALQIAWFHNSLLLLFQSFNRLLFLCYPAAKYDRFFGAHRIWYFICASWFVGVAMGVPSFWPCCHFTFVVDEYAFDNVAGGSLIIDYVDIFYSLTILGAVMFVHAFIFRDFRRRANAIQSESVLLQQLYRRREKRLLVQLFVGTVLLVIDEVVGNVVPMITESRFGGFLGSMVEIVAMASNGVVFLGVNETVNEEARTMLRRAFGLHGGTSPAVGIQLAPGHHIVQPMNRQNANAIVPVQG